jgi:hypothetical protein
MYVVKSIENVYVDPDENIIENKSEHHVDGEPRKNNSEEEYTVLRKPNGLPEYKTSNQFRRTYELVLKTRPIEKEGNNYVIKARFNQKICTAFTFQDGKNTTRYTPLPAKLVCKDIKIIIQEELIRIKPRFLGLNKNEVKEILKKIAKSQMPNAQFKIRNIWLIGHSDIRF